jgi:hypothetical protein
VDAGEAVVEESWTLGKGGKVGALGSRIVMEEMSQEGEALREDEMKI